MAQRVRAYQIGDVRLDSMRAWINCAEPTIAQSHRRFLERFEALGVTRESLWTCYAMAETVFAVSQSSEAAPARVERLEREAFPARGAAIPVAEDAAPAVEVMPGGALLASTQVRIVDERRQVLEDRRVGEIAIHCDSLFQARARARAR